LTPPAADSFSFALIEASPRVVVLIFVALSSERPHNPSRYHDSGEEGREIGGETHGQEYPTGGPEPRCMKDRQCPGSDPQGQESPDLQPSAQATIGWRQLIDVRPRAGRDLKRSAMTPPDQHQRGHRADEQGDKEKGNHRGTIAQPAPREDGYICGISGGRLPHLWIGKKGAMTPSGIRQMVWRRSQEAGIGRIHPHQLRHTFAYLARQRGQRGRPHETDRVEVPGDGLQIRKLDGRC
jgi:hypothetical protein